MLGITATVGEPFDCDHETVKAHIAQTEAFLNGVPDPRTTRIAPPDTDIRGGFAEHFVLYTLMQDQSGM
jgi:hypothetical protein